MKRRHKRRTTILGVLAIIAALILFAWVLINALVPTYDAKPSTIYSKYQAGQVSEEYLQETYRKIKFQRNNGLPFEPSKHGWHDSDVQWLTERYKKNR